jgi:formate hydrogenlyase subunit 4
MNSIAWIVQLTLIPLASPLFIGIIKKLKAQFQNRQGASILQPYSDLWKLMHKDEIISGDASFIFRIAPFIIFSVTIVVGASIPLFASYLKNGTGDILMIVYALAIGTFFLALAGIDIGGPFGGFGASREMTISALAEGGFIFSLVTIALINHSSNVFTISSANLLAHSQFFLPLILAFGGFFIVLLAETARYPFDNPATHLELTMIHEAMILEYSGKRLALIEWAAANKFLIFCSLAGNLFFPLGLATHANLESLLIGIIAFMIKNSIFCLVIAIIESSIAKSRFFRLPDLLMISFILNIIAIGLIF